MTSVYQESVPVVSAICEEPEGAVERNVYFLTLSRENVQKLWEKASKFPLLFWQGIPTFEDFAKMVYTERYDGSITANGLFWVIDDFVGVYYLTDIIAGVDALVHYSFFDRRQLGREELTKRILKYAFEQFGFNRLSAEIPTHAREYTFNFATQLGFRYEGKKRQCVYYRNTWYDKKLYGLLKDEI